MAIAEVQVNSLGELLDKVTPGEPDQITRRRRDSGVYRGVNVVGHLLTSLDQLGGLNPPHTKAALEGHLLRNFIRYSRPYLSTPPANEWELLVTAQHYGLPTRLLDWTNSPLIAAHFATVDGGEPRDRVVWRLDWRQLHRAFKLPELAFMVQDLENLLRQDHPFTPWKLFARRCDEPAFACMFEPPSIDERIVAQAAVFTLCSDTSQSFDDFLKQHDLETALTKFVIPAAAVGRVRDQLDLASVDERRIFPDLGGVAAQLRRYYS